MKILASVTCIAAALVAAAPPTASAQSIEDRMDGVADAKVRFSFASRPGVCGDGRSHISWGGGHIVWHGGGSDWERDCDEGPVRVQLRVRDGRVYDLDTYVGGRWRSSESVVDFGMVAPGDAVEYLLSLARNARGDVGEDAILPMVLADSVAVWPELIRVARDASIRRDTRRSAVFWLGQAAGDAATAELEALARDDDADREIRESAIFALSQQPHGEGVPALIEIARTNPDGELVKKALFWLGQSDDPRALDLFEELLLNR